MPALRPDPATPGLRLRSLLFVPGDPPKRMEKAPEKPTCCVEDFARVTAHCRRDGSQVSLAGAKPVRPVRGTRGRGPRLAATKPCRGSPGL